MTRNEAMTTELTIHVPPKSKESWVTALVSSNKNPAPRKKKCKWGRLVFQERQLAFRKTSHTARKKSAAVIKTVSGMERSVKYRNGQLSVARRVGEVVVRLC